MRIAQIVNSLEMGGLERLAVDLAVAQKASGHDPCIFCVARRGVLANDAERQGIPVILLGKSAGPSLRTIWRLAREFRGRNIELVHSHNSLIHHYAVLAGLLAGGRIVVNTQHGGGRVQADRKLERIYRCTIPFTHAVVVVSETTRKHMVESCGVPERKSRTIVNGIRVEKFQAHRARPGQRHPKVVFGAVGRLIPAKDQITLIEGFARVKASLPDAELRIAGEGPSRSVLERRIQELGLGDSIRLHGEVLDIPAFLEDLDVFVLSSLTEGLPLAILEAMAAGLPIVSTPVGGITEVAPEGTVAVYCECSNPEQLARSLLAVSDPATLRSMADAAFLHACNIAGLDHTWSQYERLFLELHAHRLTGTTSRARMPSG